MIRHSRSTLSARLTKRGWLLVAVLGLGGALAFGCGGDASSSAPDPAADGGSPAAVDAKPDADRPLPSDPQSVAARGVAHLLSLFNNGTDLAWGPQISGRYHVGTNAMVLNGLLRAPAPALPSSDNRVRATLEHLMRLAHDNPHGIVWSGAGGAGSAVYESSTSLRAFVEAARRDPAWRQHSNVDETIRRVRRYLLSAQIDEVQELGFEDDYQVSGPEDERFGAFYGGWGYGQIRREGRGPANMSTTNLAMEALYESFNVVEGTEEEREAFVAAQEKLQNYLRHVHNLREYQGPQGETRPWNHRPIANSYDVDAPGESMPGTDGGAVYSPGSSKAGDDVLEGGMRSPRSYGSMTFALLRLYVMSGIATEDPRVQSAYNWVRRAENYTFEHNPGMPMDGRREFEGLYYYLYTAADTLARLAPDGEVEDSRGEVHNWRADIARQLAQGQQRNGSWQNLAGRWEESDPRIAGAYALIALGFVAEGEGPTGGE